MTIGIYRISIENHTYIGSSKNVEGRLKRHLSKLSCGNHGNSFMQNAFNKYGTFETQIIHICEASELRSKEGMLQHFYKPDLCHRYENVDGITFTLSKETRDKMIMNHKGMTGLKHTIATRALQSVSSTGKKMLIGACQKMSDAKKGKKQKPEVVAARAAKIRLRNEEKRALRGLVLINGRCYKMQLDTTQGA